MSVPACIDRGRGGEGRVRHHDLERRGHEDGRGGGERAACVNEGYGLTSDNSRLGMCRGGDAGHPRVQRVRTERQGCSVRLH